MNALFLSSVTVKAVTELKNKAAHYHELVFQRFRPLLRLLWLRCPHDQSGNELNLYLRQVVAVLLNGHRASTAERLLWDVALPAK